MGSTHANTMNKTPATLLSDALTSFNRAATLAFSAAQDQARKDAAQTTADAREARRERDEAVNALHASRLEEQAWKQEAGVWKATANQAELTINHHLETIAQLRQEATQWKNQCLRLEETSRQEAISWKEQFLRVEQERSKLAQRVEELVAEQLGSSGNSKISAMPYTPMARYSAMGDLSASTRRQHASALDSLSPGVQGHLLSKSVPSASKTGSSTNRSRTGPALQLSTPISENQRNARQRTTKETVPISQSASSSSGTRQILIRRVQAVVEVPVKEESVDRDIPTSVSNVASNSTSVSASASALDTKFRAAELSKATKRRASTKRTYVEIDDENSEGDDAKTDAEEYQPFSDGDDELLMGVESQTNRKEVYGMKRVPKPISFQKATSVMTKKRREPPPNKRSRPLLKT